MRKPTKKQVAKAKAEIEAENKKSREYTETPEYVAACEENSRRASLPSEDPEHIHGMMCDGQDGSNSYCDRLRNKLFGAR